MSCSFSWKSLSSTPSFTFDKKEQGLIGLQNKKNKRMVLGGKEWGNQNKIKLKLEGPNKDY
jgi:hypothetical protein